MGMDVAGVQPDNETGEYFRANVWYWHPLWDYVERFHADLARRVEYAHTNDGDGLDGDDSRALADRLDADLANGAVARYQAEYEATLAALADEVCDLCHGTGTREWPEGTTQAWIDKCNGCNGCHGAGTRRPSDTYYHFDEGLVREFAAFLRHCGGFEIW